MSGHSQGAGHVAFIAKRYPLLRVILLSGPQELLTYEDDEELSSRSWLQGCCSTRDIMTLSIAMASYQFFSFFPPN